MDAIELSIFSSRISAVCEEMGVVLRRTAFSPNIKDRLDFSCAVFDAQGELCAQAAHIPVHLGSMAYAMRSIVSKIEWHDHDMVILNDPFLGGTHLPDVTLIAPVFVTQESEQILTGFVVNRAHHADIGASSPGSMPLSKSLDEEGVVIPPSRLIRHGELDKAFLDSVLAHMRNPAHARGDFVAQISANKVGVKRLAEFIAQQGIDEFQNGLLALNDYAERLAQTALADIPDGEYQFTDYLDDDGMGSADIPIAVSIRISGHSVDVDFAGTARQVKGNINCPLSVAAAGVYYAFRCLMPAQTPACSGAFRSINLSAPEGCLLNAKRPAAVTAGNVETSTRVVDVVFGALAEAVANKIAAASHGSMNNLAMGGVHNGRHWDYYETMGGGMGASKNTDGLSAVQTHMTNTLNTPIESLEMHYPLRVTRYGVRQDSGGDGSHRGGDGIVREFEFLDDAHVTLLTERRRIAPWGLGDGDVGKPGENRLDDKPLPGKCSQAVKKGQRLRIETPGGGGYR